MHPNRLAPPADARVIRRMMTPAALILPLLVLSFIVPAPLLAQVSGTGSAPAPVAGSVQASSAGAAQASSAGAPQASVAESAQVSSAGSVQGEGATDGSAANIRRVVSPEEFGKFESLGQLSFSDDGRWVAAPIGRVEDDGEVRIHAATGGGASGAEPRVIPNGLRAEFSGDNRWVAVTVQLPQEERRALEKDREPVRNDVVLHRLGSDEEERVKEVQSHAFSPDGRFLMMRRYRVGGEDVKHQGADLIVRELATGIDANFGNVSEAAWAEDSGALLAMVVDAAGMAGNGVRVYDAGTGRLRTLHAETQRFEGMTWRKDARDLALFRARPDTVRGDTVYAVLAWRGADRDGVSPAVLPGEVQGQDGEELRVVPARGLRWAEAGGRLFFGVRARAESDGADGADDADDARGADGADDPGDGAGGRQGGDGGSGGDAGPDSDAEDPPAPAERKKIHGEDEAPGVEIWHARDVDPIPQQRLRASQERQASAMTAWDFSGEPVILGGDALHQSIMLTAKETVALLTDASPYTQDAMFGPAYADYYRVDLASGERTLLAERTEHFRGVSPGGRYLVFFRDDHFFVHDMQRGETRNITADIPATFTNEQVDVVVPQKPPYGVGGWTAGDQHVLLYDRYDIWRVRPDGEGAERLTRGAEDDVRHRLVRLDPDEDAFPANGPWFVSLYGEWTKNSGYARLRPGRDVERLVFEDRGVGRLMKADKAEVYGFVAQRYDQPPALHVTDQNLRSPRRVVTTNDFVEEEYLWGRAELLDYENDWGVPLQASLIYPADYEPGRRYPMVVYHYERLSQGLHNWTNPTQRSAYNTTAFSQNGYFVLLPDIVYRPRNPGLSFMESMMPAVDAAVATGMIDEARMGITGHSWGGYQTTFSVTQTNRFAAAVAGAPLTNLMSMYLSFYWNSGSTDARIFEVSQGRMQVPWWEDFESYRANSPVHHITEMNTPFLMAFGDEDGAVEFNQGVEFYNAARRAGKDFVLLVYEGENHGLRERPNQMDYYRRTHEWFAHYLKGEPAPAWITEGVRYVDQQEKLKEGPAAGRVPGPRLPVVTSVPES